MPQPLRNTGEMLSGGYRYSFNGKEKIDEVSGSGNSIDFGARIYDCRVGRWMSGDKLASAYPSNSHYCFAGNNPILLSDIDGNIWVDPYGRPIVTSNGVTSTPDPLIISATPANQIDKSQPSDVYYADILVRKYEQVTIYGNDGTPIQALRLVEAKVEKGVKIQLTGNYYSDGSPEYIVLKNGTFEDVKNRTDIDANADCHGYTFAGNNIWINNDEVSKLIAADNWQTVDENNADIVVYYENGDVVHSAVRDGNGNYDYNAGITTGGRDESLEGAAGNLDYDQTIFYKRTEDDYVYNGKTTVVGKTAQINASKLTIDATVRALKKEAEIRRNGN